MGVTKLNENIMQGLAPNVIVSFINVYRQIMNSSPYSHFVSSI